jgi:hypothetical protein
MAPPAPFRLKYHISYRDIVQQSPPILSGPMMGQTSREGSEGEYKNHDAAAIGRRPFPQNKTRPSSPAHAGGKDDRACVHLSKRPK